MRLNKPSLRVDSVAFGAGHNEVARPRQLALRKQVLRAVVLPFREDAPAIITHDQVRFLDRIAVDNTGSQDIDAVATTETIGDFQDAVGGFGEGVGQPGVEEGEYLFVPVVHGSAELDELGDVRELTLPLFKSPLCISSAGAVPNVVKRLFRLPSPSQRRRVGQPAIEYELRTRRQSMSALLKQEAAFHCRSLRLHRGQLTSGGDAYRVKMFVCGSDDVEFVHDDNGLRKVNGSQISVGAPHVHGQVADTFAAGQMRHPVADASFAVGFQEIENLASKHVDQDSTQPARQVHLVDAKNLRGIEVTFFQQFRDVFALNVAARLLVDANVAGNVRGRTNEGLDGDVVVTPRRHPPVGGHVRKALEEGISAFPALEAFHRNVDHGLFSVNWSVNVFGDFRTMTDEAADDAALRAGLRRDVVTGFYVIPFVNLHVGHRPVRKIKCIVCHGRPFGATHTAFGLTCGVFVAISADLVSGLQTSPETCLALRISKRPLSLDNVFCCDKHAFAVEFLDPIRCSIPIYELPTADGECQFCLVVIGHPYALYDGDALPVAQSHGIHLHTKTRNQDSTYHGQIHTLFRKADDRRNRGYECAIRYRLPGVFGVGMNTTHTHMPLRICGKRQRIYDP